ncbi:MAG: PIN domain-containing protein, partial [Oxalobacteraceae bacterium]|nr:PIN domain-containing protein [Oxalobacteraceae bacterium]
MPLPKMPSKPAALLSQADYPKAEKGRTVRPAIALVSNTPVAKVKTELPAAEKPAERKARADSAGKSQTSKLADKRGITKLFVLDTNVLMHDPTSLFRFEEHDVYLPMITLEELDNHKKGMSEVARNARQVSRSLDALVADV